MKTINHAYLLLISIVITIFSISSLKSSPQDESIPDETTFIPVDKEATLDMDKLMKSIVYPEAAIKAGVEGKVLVKVFIDKAGKAKRYKIEKSVSAELDSAAATAIMNAGYKPASDGGKSVGFWLMIPVKFELPSIPIDSINFNMKDDLNVEKSGETVKVVIRVFIDRTGTPLNPKIISSDNEKFNQSAIDIVMKKHINPRIVDGKPIGSWGNITVTFHVNPKNEIIEIK